MTYKALLIRAYNANGVAAAGRRPSRSRNAELAARLASQTQPAPFLPRLPPAFIYYGVQENLQAQTSITDGAITGYEHRRLSPKTLSTLHELQRKAKRGKHFDKLTSIFFDKSSPGFDWLIDGWLAEKRILPQNTHHWLYYDPLGVQYRSKQHVFRLWKEQDYLSYHHMERVSKTKTGIRTR